MKRLTLLACSLLLAGSAFATAPVTEHPGAAPILLGLEAVQKDLKITPAQAGRIDAIRANFRESARKIVASTDNSPAAVAKSESKLESLKAKANEQAVAVLSKDQKARFVEIEHQMLGGTMLTSPAVQKTLGLTPSQAAAIESIRKGGEAYASRINAQFAEAKISHQERIELLRARRLADADKMIAVLDPGQQKQKVALGGRPLVTM